MLVRKAAHEVAGMELELCLRTVIVCVDDDGPKLLALESVPWKNYITYIRFMNRC